MEKKIESNLNFMFWFHAFLVLIAWTGPFLFSWYMMVTVYAILMAQFLVFGKCLMNKSHGLEDLSDDKIFYTELLNLMGFYPNKTKLKFFVHRILYIILGSVAIIWQVVLGHAPVLF